MAELRFKILADLTQLKKDLKDTLEKKFKIGAEGDGGGVAGGGKDSKKNSKAIIGMAAATSGILGFLLAGKPLRDLFKIGLNFIILSFLKLLKFLFVTLPTFFGNLGALIGKIMAKIGEFLKELPSKIWNFLKALPGMIWNFLKALPGMIWGLLKAGFNLIVTGVKLAIEGVKIIINKLVGFLKSAFKFTSDILKKLLTFIKAAPKRIWDFLKVLPEKIWNFMKAGFNFVKLVILSVVDSIKKLPSKIWEKVKGLDNLIARAIGDFFSFGSGRRVGDAILRPSGEVIQTDPKDTIIATQNPNGLGGGTKIFNFHGVTSEEMTNVLKRELGIGVTTSSRF